VTPTGTLGTFVRVLEDAGLGPASDRPALVAADGERLELPDAMLTTQEAADYLGISRPTLVRILDRGEIPMEKPGRHRFVRLKDLVEYQDRAREARRAALEAMVDDAERNGLYATTDRMAPKTR